MAINYLTGQSYTPYLLSTQPKPTPTPTLKAAPIPVPTPNPASGTGSGYPSATTYDSSSNSWTETPAWDYGRYTDPKQYSYNTDLTNTSRTQQNLPPVNPAPVTPTSTAPGPLDSKDTLIRKLMDSGYNEIDARNAANGPDADKLTREYLGGDSGGSAPNPLLSKDYRDTNLGNSVNEPSDFWKEIYDAAQAGNQSAIDAINSQYGYNESELNRQLGMTDTYQGNDLATLLSQFNKANTDIGTQRTSAKETVDTETAKAADQARMTQKQNRNVLRALGILGSTYAAENLAAPINQFDKQKAELVNWGTKRMGELENYANEKRDEYDRLTNEVKTKYGELRDKIMGDLRYNNQQKADALKAATAGAQQNLAQLNMQKAQYEQQIQQYSQSLNTQIAQMLMNKAPNANLDDIAKQSIAFTNQLTNTNPNVAIYQGPQKKNSLTGV